MTPAATPRSGQGRLAFSLLALLAPVCALAQEMTTPPDLHLAQLTSPEIRAAITAGYTSVIVPSGGTEQNGPHMILDKHNVIVGHAAEQIAGAVGHMLIAPTLTIVPEGDFDPPTGNMAYPGTIGLSAETYEGVVEDVVRSLRRAGFRDIFLIGDHGQSQEAQAAVAERLTGEWEEEGIRIHQVASYYDASPQDALLAARGIDSTTAGTHAGVADTSELMGITLRGVRPKVLENLPQPLEETGATGNPALASAALGKELLALRVNAAIAEIRADLATRAP